MKLPTQEQEDAVVTADMLLNFMIKTDFRNDVTRKLIEDKVMVYYVGLDADEQAASLFLEAALTYIREV